MRPVQFIHEKILEKIHQDMESSEIVKYIYSDAFAEEFRNTYKYRDRDEEVKKMFYELDHYKKVLKDTPFRCVYGEDASLQYYHMCQECGNILHDPHNERYVTDHDMMCPTCNGIDVEKYPFKTIAHGTMHWVHLVRSAEFTDDYNEKNPEEPCYISGSAKDLKFRITKTMAIRWWALVQWSKIKHIANIVRHPKQHIEKIKARNKRRAE